MPTSSVHFFTEPNAFASNTPQQSFGPQSSDVFNLTTRFGLTGNKKAFSICKGIVLVQPGSTTDKVNVILRPYKQPFSELNIKYFVYRGLNKADFFTGDLINPAGSSSTDFVNKIRADYDSFYQEPIYNQNSAQPIAKPIFTAKFIGYNDNTTQVPITTPISDFFFKESEFVDAGGVFEEVEHTSFELPMIDGGKWLGNFSGSECGIDVVLNYGDYKQDFDNSEFTFDLQYARQAYAQITLLATDSDVVKKLKREQATQFIDIVAFYGLFVKEGKVTFTDASNAVTSRAGQAIYNELLLPFASKNRWYVYIQSDRTRSYNFYGNYKISATNSHSLRMANVLPATTTPVTNLPEVDYHTNHWPLLINETTTQPAVADNTLYIDFVTDNNVNTCLYVPVGTIAKAQQNNFCDADYLRRDPDSDGNYSVFTNTIALNIPADADGKNIAGLSVLIYQGVTYSFKIGTTTAEDGTLVDVYAKPNFFDDVFDLIKATPLLQLSADTQFSKMTSQKLNLMNHYYDKKHQGISAVQTLVVNDVLETGVAATPTLERVTYITESVNLKANAVSPTGTVTTDTKTSPSAGRTVAKSKTYDLPEPYYYTLQLFTDSTQTITGLQLKTFDGSTPTKIILGLTKTENDLLKGLIDTPVALKNPRLFLIDLFDDGNELLSPENVKYQKYKAALVAEKPDGTLELFKPITDILVYSLDRKYHFSKGYSQNMKDEQKNELTLDLDLAI